MYNCGITGSSGRLGINITKKVNFRFNIFKGDISKKKQVDTWVKKNNFDIIIHLAAIVPTYKVEENYLYSKKVNYYGTKYLIDSIVKYKKKPKLFFFSSSSHVYKVTKKLKKIKETEKTIPVSLYGKTKLMAENYIKKKLKKNNINYCIGRIFSFTDKHQDKSFLVPSLFNKIKNCKSEINLKDLNHYRDFLVISDVSKAIEILCKKQIKGIVNIGSEKPVHLKDIAKFFSNKYRKKINYIYSNKKSTYLIADNKKLRKTGWRQSKNFISQLKVFK